MLRTIHHNSERHYLQSEHDEQPILIEEPIGWQEEDRKISRSKKTGEMIEKSSKSIQFIGTARRYILENDALYGNEVKIKYIIVTENPKNARDFIRDVYFLDLASLVDKEQKLAVKIKEGGLSKLIKSKGNNKFELDRTTDINRQKISELEKEKITINGRKIFLQTGLKTPKQKNRTLWFNKKNSHSSPLGKEFDVKPTTNNHKDFVFPVEYSGGYFGKDIQGSKAFFRNDSPFSKTLHIKVKGSVDFIEYQRYGFKYVRNAVALGVFKPNGNNYQLKKAHLLKERTKWESKDYILNEGGSMDDSHGYKKGGKSWQWFYTKKYKLEVDTTITITLEKKEILVFYGEVSAWGVYQKGSGIFEGLAIDRAGYYVEFENDNFEINIEEDSEIPKTQTNCLFPHEVGERFLEILTGQKNKFKSDFLGRKDIGYDKDGKGAYSMIYPLLWVRGLEKSKDKKPSLSLNHFIEAINTIWGTSTMIEMNGFEECLRLEPISFFYIPQTTIELPNIVQDFKKTYAQGFMHTSYNVGYLKGGTNYQETTGQGEFNGKATYTTIRTSKPQQKNLLSPIRADSYAEEFARRKTNKQEDSQYDLDWFIKDCIKENNTIRERKYTDTYKKVKNIYSPETATNVRFTPLNILLRNRFFIKGNLSHYQDSDLIYTSSNCNSEITLIDKNDNTLKANQDIPISTLGKTQFKPYWITFKHDVTFDIKKQLRAKQIINGKEMYNFYGKVKFKINHDTFLKGYIFEVNETKGTWKVLVTS